MEHELWAPEEPNREELIIRACSNCIPTILIARLLGLDTVTITRRREKLGINISLVQGKRITSAFLRELPNLNELPLSAEERKTIRMWRQEWLVARKGDWDRLDYEADVVSRCTRVFPLRVIAAVLKRGEGYIQEKQIELDVRVSLSEQRKLAHAFGATEKPKGLGFLRRTERGLLKELWKAARKKKLAAKNRRLAKSLECAEQMKARFLQRREEVRLEAGILQLPPVTESLCSGTCGEAWPRLPEFFIENYRSPDKLGERCKYCTFMRKVNSRHDGTTRKNKSRGRIVRAAELPRLIEIVQSCGEHVPAFLLEKLFNVGSGTRERIYHAAEIHLTPKDVREIRWTWCFRNPIIAFPVLRVEEVTQLYLLTKRWREWLINHFERDKEHIRFLEFEKARILEDAWKEHAERPEMRHCNHCDAEYPSTTLFFKPDKQWISYTCRVCVNYFAAQKRLSFYRRKYG